MTIPVAHGYPDFGRYQAQADRVLWQEANTTVDAQVTRGPFFVGDVQHVAHMLDLLNQHAVVVIEYYDSAALSTPLGDQNIDLRADGGFDYSLPVQGPWMLVRITPVAAGAEIDYKIWTVASPISSLRGNSSPYLIAWASSNVGAGVTVTTSAVRTEPGLAHLYFQGDPATWLIHVEALFSNGAVVRIASVNQGQGRSFLPLLLPHVMIQVKRTNSSGAAGVMEFALVGSGVGILGQG